MIDQADRRDGGVTVIVRPFDFDRDTAAVAALWRDAQGTTWPLAADRLGAVLDALDPARDGAHFVAEAGAGLLGFVATQTRRSGPAAPPEGYLPALLIVSAARRRGLGTALHDRALAHLREQGVRRVQLGGGEPRFWPGVPTNLPGAEPFFRARGWAFDGLSHDLIRDLRAPHAPDPGWGRAPAGIAIAVATPADIPDLLAFERREFPAWQGAYAALAARGVADDFLIARRADGALVGALILYAAARSRPPRHDVPWSALLGDDCGGLGAVGVAAAARGRGVGAALVAHGSAVLSARGVGTCCIGWTWLLDFYGRDGYRHWRSYAMSWRDL